MKRVIVGKGKLQAEVTLLAMAQDVSQTGRLHVQPAVHVLRGAELSRQRATGCAN